MPFALIRFETEFNHAWEIEKHKNWDARLAQKTRRDPDACVLNNPTNLTDPTGFACAEASTGSNIKPCNNTGDDQVLKRSDGSVEVLRGNGTGKTLESLGLKIGSGGVVMLDVKNPGQTLGRIHGVLTTMLEGQKEPKTPEENLSRLNNLIDIRDTYTAAAGTLGISVAGDSFMLQLGIQIGVANLKVGNTQEGLALIGSAAVALGMTEGQGSTGGVSSTKAAGSLAKTIPNVSDPKLQNIVKDLFKGAKTANPIGTGSTADAIRSEAATGLATGGRFHTQKGMEYAQALEKWQAKNPNASYHDRLVAESLKNDLRNALGK